MENKNYAGFWTRFAAMTIDGVIIIFFTTFLRWLIQDSLNLHPYEYSYDDELNLRIISYALWSLNLIIIQWCYFAGMESSPLQATIGKLATGIYVTNLKGERISFAQASGRHFGKIISGIILNIGYILAAFTEKKQALHDMMSNSLVLKK